jgi:alpha-tubulin suppressor-like RCC1 family protein
VFALSRYLCVPLIVSFVALGIGSTTALAAGVGGDEAGASSLAAGTGARVAAGGGHTCAVLSTGAVACWGDGASGQLGDGSTTDSSVPVAVQGLTEASSIATGDAHSCAALVSGRVDCWGNGGSGQLGDRSHRNSPLPVEVRGIRTAIAVSAGDQFSCALLANGRVRCWGSDYDGELGDGSTSEQPKSVPSFVRGLSSAVAISSAGSHSCALLANRHIKCWGSDPYGQLGYDAPQAITIRGVSGAVAVAAGGGAISENIAENDSEFTCAIVRYGRILCWGDNRSGQLGSTQKIRASPSPIHVAGLTGATHLAAGVQHVCAILSGKVSCWGDNRAGELGDGSSRPTSTATEVVGVTEATAIAAGGNFGSAHTCTLLANSSVECWGDNGFGQLGDGITTPAREPVPVLLGGS